MSQVSVNKGIHQGHHRSVLIEVLTKYISQVIVNKGPHQKPGPHQVCHRSLLTKVLTDRSHRRIVIVGDIMFMAIKGTLNEECTSFFT